MPFHLRKEKKQPNTPRNPPIEAFTTVPPMPGPPLPPNNHGIHNYFPKFFPETVVDLNAQQSQYQRSSNSRSKKRQGNARASTASRRKLLAPKNKVQKKES